MQWKRPLHAAEKDTSHPQGIRTIWVLEVGLEKWIMAKQQFSHVIISSSQCCRPLIGSRPSTEGLFFNRCQSLPYLVFCANFSDPLCKKLSNMWEGRSVSIYLAMNNRSTFENKSVCIATCRHIKCLSERREKSECERATDCSSCDSWKSWARSLGAWHGTQIRLRIMIGLY